MTAHSKTRSSPPLKPQWFQILLALADGRRHGQGIMAEVLRQTEGAMKLWPTSLYGSLRALDEAELLRESPIEESDGDRRRFYELTEEGRVALASEVARLERTVALARRKKVLDS
ncbi:MAG: helix-turn-helix transcriptional regulator [Acidobacteriota bacterium]